MVSLHSRCPTYACVVAAYSLAWPRRCLTPTTYDLIMKLQNFEFKIQSSKFWISKLATEMPYPNHLRVHHKNNRDSNWNPFLSQSPSKRGISQCRHHQEHPSCLAHFIITNVVSIGQQLAMHWLASCTTMVNFEHDGMVDGFVKSPLPLLEILANNW